ncbi:pyocin knob domain-containing protein [Lactococcus formosensis subsp. formosensis]|uniref:pyocin knob domain-containing protein n=1 Tax=Lactococcus formosensis TaxID=1281486 RepID=UPI003854D768
MAIWTFPLKSINGSNMYSDKDFRRFYANIFSSGIIPNVDLEGNLSLQVLQTETPSMNIRVGPGVDMINGGHIMNTAIKEFPIPAPLTTQERIDCIVAQWNDSTNSGDIIYKKNTTQIVRSQDIWEHKLAEIVVPANASSISQANITDTRANPDVCGYSSPFEKIDVGDLVAQFKALTDEYNLEFQAWFENLKNQLDDNQAANLQNQIDTINGVIVQKNIPDGANLDDYKIEGEFSKKTPTIVTGAPEGVTGAFRLSVRTMLGSSGIFQTLYDYVTRSMYYRIGNTTLGFNLPWKKVATMDDIKELTAGDTEMLGLPLSGVVNATVSYQRKNGVVFVKGAGNWGSFEANKERFVGTLPVGFRSSVDWSAGMNSMGGSQSMSAKAAADGRIGITCDIKKDGVYGGFSMSFPVK